ncbi:MAG: site-2 protease family protein [Bifidobacteriaceae bacterium]|jgi:Zn-dependent protease/CBS domain-containing protein|nr:site-2 protease family protein [Bifidobacteriaceae bacterium]
MERGLRVGRIGGAPVVVAWSWWLIALVLVGSYYGSFAQVLGPARGLALSGAVVVFLFASVFLHELGHGLTAQRLGLRVHQYTLTFFGGETTFDAAERGPGQSAAVSVMGPAVNVALAVIAWAAMRVPALGPWPRTLAYWLMVTNLFLAVFNLIPAIPMDGGGLLEALVWKLAGRRSTGTLVAGWVGVAVGAALVIWGLVASTRSWSAGIWPLLVGLMIAPSAWGSVRRGRHSRRVDAIDLQELVRPALVLATGTPLAEAVRALAATPFVLVAAPGGPGAPIIVGVVDQAAAFSVPPARLAGTPVEAALIPLPAGVALRLGMPGRDAVATMASVADRVALLPVLGAEGGVVGVVLMRDLAERLRDAS